MDVMLPIVDWRRPGLRNRRMARQNTPTDATIGVVEVGQIGLMLAAT